MIPVPEAEAIILEAGSPLSMEWVHLSAAQNRILAETLYSNSDFPSRATSSMDGYAVRQADLAQMPQDLDVIETVPAGSLPQQALQPGQATRLFTGSVLPVGSDTVIMQEQTERNNHQVRILKPAALGQFVRPPGDFCRQADPVIAAGIRLQAPELAVAAAIGRSAMPVYRRPQVAILSTGNELVRLDQQPQPGQIIDSNHYGLAALVQAAGGIPQAYGIVPDDPVILRSTIAQALQTADVVISSGGVSVGDFDYVERLLAELGGDIRIRSVAIKPGKPLTVAVFPGQPPKLYFGLPGNPVSAMVTFWRFVHPLLRKLQGQDPPWGLPVLNGITQAPLQPDPKRETYLWGRIRFNNGQLEFHPATHLNSGNLFSLATTQGLAILPAGGSELSVGASVAVMLVSL